MLFRPNSLVNPFCSFDYELNFILERKGTTFFPDKPEKKPLCGNWVWSKFRSAGATKKGLMSNTL